MSYEQAVILFNEKNYKEAFEIFSQCKNTNSYFYLGICHEENLVSRSDIWIARTYYELCIIDNNIFKQKAIIRYIHLSLKMYKHINDQINLFFITNNKNSFKYFIGYAYTN
jgi:hypothetical protein